MLKHHRAWHSEWWWHILRIIHIRHWRKSKLSSVHLRWSHSKHSSTIPLHNLSWIWRRHKPTAAHKSIWCRVSSRDHLRRRKPHILSIVRRLYRHHLSAFFSILISILFLIGALLLLLLGSLLGLLRGLYFYYSVLRHYIFDGLFQVLPLLPLGQ